MEAIKQKQAVHCRWMIRRDLPESVEISRLCSRNPWSEEDFISVLRKRSMVGVVAECRELIRGFHVYELFKNRIVILNFAVHPTFQRMAIGTQMIDRLKAKLDANRRHKLDVFVRESNMPALKFFQSQGFLATGMARG